MAAITVSTGIVNSDPSMGMGLRLPPASNSPRDMRTHSIAWTLPAFSMMLFGATRVCIFTPSFSASAISSSYAGISSFSRRYSTKTSLAPILRADLAASIATFPPPITATFPSTFTAFPRFRLRRKVMPSRTPSAPSPGIPSI